MTIVETAARPLRSASGAAVSVDGVSKVFGHGASRVVALDAIDIRVAPGEFVCVVGASGCGKTTLLNLIAGLDRADRRTHRGERAATPSCSRSRRCSRGSPRPRTSSWRCGCAACRAPSAPGAPKNCSSWCTSAGFGDKRPHELSGGMRQRVALARALAQDADVLLMDEPFGALDAMTRDLLHDELERIWRQTGVTVLFVTHNVREAARLADRIVLLTSRPGRVAAEFDVGGLSRPRRIESREVSSLAATITDRLRAEVARHGRR